MSDKKLSKYFDKLNKDSQKTLIAFAKFLASDDKNCVATVDLSIKPIFYSGDDTETVIGALKRLQIIYTMIDTNDIFNAASKLMTEHMMQGRDKKEVITELETLFKNHYKKILAEDKND